jgi:hypothetical protein
MPDGGTIWDMFLAGFGPTKALAASLDDTRREQLKHDFIAYHERYLSDLGVTMPRDYLIALGRRK